MLWTEDFAGDLMLKLSDDQKMGLVASFGQQYRSDQKLLVDGGLRRNDKLILDFACERIIRAVSLDLMNGFWRFELGETRAAQCVNQLLQLRKIRARLFLRECDTSLWDDLFLVQADANPWPLGAGLHILRYFDQLIDSSKRL